MNAKPEILAEFRRDRQIMLGVCAAGLASAIILPIIGGWSVDWLTFLPGIQIGVLMLLFWPYTSWRQLDRITVALETAVVGIVLAVPTLIISYATTRTAMPLADAQLESLDLAFGFHWASYMAWIDGHYLLERALWYAYISFAPQLLVVPLLLGATGQFRRAYMFIFGYFVICAVSCTISIWFPALGYFESYSMTEADFDNVTGYLAYTFLEAFHDVRSNADFVLSMDNAHGIITFPSIHAGIACLCGWAMWRTPVLKWGFLVLNILMLVSAISHGGHYMVDLPAGALVAIFTIWGAYRLFGGTRLAWPKRDVVAADAAPAT